MYPRRKSIPAACVCLIWAMFAPIPAHAQSREANSPAFELARWVPASTGVLLEVVDLRLLERQMGDGPIWEPIPRLIGLESGTGEEGTTGSIREQLGLTREQAIQTLFGRDVAVALPSIGRASEGLLIARLARRGDLRILLGTGGWSQMVRRGKLRWYTSATGLRLVTAGEIVIIGHALESHPFLDACAKLLQRAGGDSLAKSAGFVQLTAGLPRRGVGLAYLARHEDGTGSESGIDGSALLPPWFRRGVIALEAYDGGGRVYFATLAPTSLSAVSVGSSLPSVLRLPVPKEALLAATIHASVVDILDWLEADSAAGPRNLAAQLIRTALAGTGPGDGFLTLLDGPTTLLIAGPLRPARPGAGRPGLPRFALIMPSSDAQASMRALDTAMGKLVAFAQMVRATGPNTAAGSDTLRIEESNGDGGAYRFIALAPLAWAEDASDPNRDLQLAWGRAGMNVVVATDVTLMQAIQSAPMQRAEVHEGDRLRIKMRPRRLGALAESWLDYAADRNATILKDEWRSLIRSRRSAARAGLGAGLRPDADQPGKVEVARIFRGTQAERVLKQGDRIVGVGGRVLSLEDPLGDLRSALRAQAGKTVSLRIERDGRMRDVEARLPRWEGWAETVGNPLSAIGPLLAMARRVESVEGSASVSGNLVRGVMELRMTAAPQVTTVGPASGAEPGGDD